jgi:peroxiredoxin
MDAQEKQFDYRSVILAVSLIAGLLVLVLLHRNRSSDSPVQQVRIGIGLPAPDFAFPGLDGKMVRLSDHRGKTVLVNIWATWCPSCVDEMPSMEKLYRKLNGENFEILAVSIDGLGETVVAPFMKKYQLTFPALIDSEGAIRMGYRTTGVPESFIIDKNGMLVQKIVGAINWAHPEVLRYFRDLMEKP